MIFLIKFHISFLSIRLKKIRRLFNFLSMASLIIFQEPNQQPSSCFDVVFILFQLTSFSTCLSYISLKFKRRIGKAFMIKYACFKSNFFSVVKRLLNQADFLINSILIVITCTNLQSLPNEYIHRSQEFSFTMRFFIVENSIEVNEKAYYQHRIYMYRISS